jgi:DNA-binding PadR family transcriptional regulator
MCGVPVGSEEIEDLISDFARFYILLILYEGPAHGYSILRKFRSRVGRSISPGLVYPFLQMLLDRGLLTYKVQPVGRKERKLYALTDEGVRFCNQLFRRFAGLVSTAIEPSLDTCANCGCKIYEGGYTENINGVETTFCCIHCAEAYKRTTKMQ